MSDMKITESPASSFITGEYSFFVNDNGELKQVDYEILRNKLNVNTWQSITNKPFATINGMDFSVVGDMLTIKNSHTHTNKDVLDKFGVDENGNVTYDGAVIGGGGTYILPTASTDVLGGVKIDGDTIKINDGVISADVIGNWTSNTYYPVGYFAVHDDKLYECISANSDTEWNESHWSMVGGAGGGSEGQGIATWTANTVYNVGDIVINDITLYKCTVQHTSETSFNSTEQTKWVSLSGSKGIDGINGVSPTVTVNSISGGTQINITDINGEHSSFISNGNNGEDGLDGKSAYEIAIENGYIGSEEEWLASLKGTDGTTTITSTKIDKTATFLVSNWSNSLPYTQTVEVDGITSALNPRIDLVVSDNVATGLKEETAFACITRGETINGAIVLKCYEEKPSVNFTIQIEVI